MTVEIHYIHTNSWGGFSATPCVVLSQGPKYATVKLLADFHVGRKWYLRGTTKNRVPLKALSPTPRKGTHVVAYDPKLLEPSETAQAVGEDSK